jgi:hypothetical protein
MWVTNHQQNSVVNFHQDFMVSPHSDFFQGLIVGGLLYWPNHSRENLLPKQQEDSVEEAPLM